MDTETENQTGSDVTENGCHGDTTQKDEDCYVKVTEVEERKGMDESLFGDKKNGSLNPVDVKSDEKELSNHIETETVTMVTEKKVYTTEEAVNSISEKEQVEDEGCLKSKSGMIEKSDCNTDNDTEESSRQNCVTVSAEIHQMTNDASRKIEEEQEKLDCEDVSENSEENKTPISNSKDSEIKKTDRQEVVRSSVIRSTREGYEECKSESKNSKMRDLERKVSSSPLFGRKESKAGRYPDEKKTLDEEILSDISSDGESNKANSDNFKKINSTIADESVTMETDKFEEDIVSNMDGSDKTSERRDNLESISEERENVCSTNEKDNKEKSTQGEVTLFTVDAEEGKITCSGDNSKISEESPKIEESHDRVTSSTENQRKEEVTPSDKESEEMNVTCSGDDLTSCEKISISEETEEVTSSDIAGKQEETTLQKSDSEKCKDAQNEEVLRSDSEEKSKLEKEEKVTSSDDIEKEEKTTSGLAVEKEDNMKLKDRSLIPEKEASSSSGEGNEEGQAQSSEDVESETLVSSDETKNKDRNAAEDTEEEIDVTVSGIFNSGKDRNAEDKDSNAEDKDRNVEGKDRNAEGKEAEDVESEKLVSSDENENRNAAEDTEEGKDSNAEDKDSNAEGNDSNAESKDRNAEGKDRNVEDKDRNAEDKDSNAEGKDRNAEGKDRNAEGKEAVGSDEIKEIIGENIVQNFDEDSFDLNINVNVSKSQDMSITEFSTGIINSLKLPSFSDSKIYQSKVVLDRVDGETASTSRKSGRRSALSTDKAVACSGSKSKQLSLSPISERRNTRKRGLSCSTNDSPENKYLGISVDDLPMPMIVLERVNVNHVQSCDEDMVDTSSKSPRSRRELFNDHGDRTENAREGKNRRPGPKCAMKRKQAMVEDTEVRSRKSTRTSSSSVLKDNKAVVSPDNSGTVPDNATSSSRNNFRNLKVRIDQSDWRKWREVVKDDNFQPAVVMEQLTAEKEELIIDEVHEPSTSSSTRRSKTLRNISPSHLSHPKASTSNDRRRFAASKGLSVSPEYQPTVILDKLSPHQAAQHTLFTCDDSEASTSTGRKRSAAIISHDAPGSSKYQPRVLLDKTGASTRNRNSDVQHVVTATEVKEAMTEEHIDVDGGSSSRPYVCDICLQDFRIKRYYVAHKLAHSRNVISNRLCHVCKNSFKSTQDLSRHIKKHGSIYAKALLFKIGKGSESKVKKKNNGENEVENSSTDINSYESRKTHTGNAAVTKIVEKRKSSLQKSVESKEMGQNTKSREGSHVNINITETRRTRLCMSPRAKRELNRSLKKENIGRGPILPLEGKVSSAEKGRDHGMSKSEESERKDAKKDKSSYNIKKHVCFECGRYFSFSADLDKHSFFHDKKAKSAQRCKICKRIFFNGNRLKAHLRMHKLQRKIKCRECGKKFYYLFSLERHLMQHHAGNLLCTICGEFCQNRKQLKLHLLLRHTDRQNPRKCSGCDQEFRSWYQLRHHVRNGCRSVFLCEKTGMTFVEKNDYVNHIMEANYGNPQCKICGKKFQEDIHRIAHLKTHHDICPYRCAYCPRSFPDRLSLKSHTRIHFSNKNLHCVLCDKVAGCRRTFIHHWLRRHEKHKCKICYRYFSKRKTRKDESSNSEDSLCRRCNAYFLNQYQKGAKRPLFHMRSWFVCKLCNHSCASKYRLHLHLKMHLEKFLPVLKKNVASFVSKKIEKSLPEEDSRSFQEVCDTDPNLLLKDLQKVSKSYDKSEKKMCNVCGITVANGYILERHMKRMHRKKPKRKCGICGQTLSNDTLLKMHLQSFHVEAAERSLSIEADKIVDYERQTRSKSASAARYNARKRKSARKGVKCSRDEPVAVDDDLSEDDDEDYSDSDCEALSSIKESLEKGKNVEVITDEDSSSDEEKDGENNGSRRTRSTGGMNFTCEKCGKKFPTAYHRDRHVRRYHKFDHLNMEILKDRKAPIKCKICGIKYSNLYCVERHMRRHHADDNVDTKCPFCNKIFYNDYNVMMHVKQFHTSQDYLQIAAKKREDDANEACKCLKCGCCFRYRRNLYNHLQKIHGLKCKDKSLVQPLTLEEYDVYLHENIGTRGDFKKFTRCQHCDQSIYLPVLQKHISNCQRAQAENGGGKTARKSKKKVSCEDCGKRFGHSVYLLLHQKYYTSRNTTCIDEIPLSKLKSLSSKGMEESSEDDDVEVPSRESLARRAKSKSNVKNDDRKQSPPPEVCMETKTKKLSFIQQKSRKTCIAKKKNTGNQSRQSKNKFKSFELESSCDYVSDEESSTSESVTIATNYSPSDATPLFSMDNLVTITKDDGSMFTTIDLTDPSNDGNDANKADADITERRTENQSESRSCTENQSESSSTSNQNIGNIPSYNIELVEIDDCKICEIIPTSTAENDNEFEIDVENVETNESSHIVTIRL